MHDLDNVTTTFVFLLKENAMFFGKKKEEETLCGTKKKNYN
jgi:hypothetical protein